MDRPDAFVESVSGFMVFIHESALAIIIAAFILRIIGGALARRGIALVAARLMYVGAVSLFLTLVCGFLLLGGLLNDGLYLATAVICFAVACTSALRGFQLLRKRPEAVGDDPASDGPDPAADASEKPGAASPER